MSQFPSANEVKMRAQICIERSIRAVAQELPGRYRLTRTPAQCLHPSFHSATDWSELNQTKIGPILPFGGSAASLTLRFHLPPLGKRRFPETGSPFSSTAPVSVLLALSQPAPTSLASSWLCVSSQDTEGTRPCPAGRDSAALPSLFVWYTAAGFSLCTILQPGYL